MDFDLALMQAVQSLHLAGGRAADIFFILLTLPGEQSFVLLFLAGIYWCADKKLGQFLALSLLASLSLNTVIKNLAARPRPFMGAHSGLLRYVKVDNLLADTASLSDSYSFPSAHSQNSAAILGGLVLRLKKRWVGILCGAIVAGVMVSRVYLGVHYPTDVIAGAALGLVAAYGLNRVFNRLYCYLPMLFALSALVASLAGGEDSLRLSALGAGVAVGALLEQRTLKFEISGGLPRRILRLALGIALVIALQAGLGMILPPLPLFEGLRYLLLGLFIMYIWPLCFTRLKI